MLSKERKEEMVQQRMHLVPNKRDHSQTFSHYSKNQSNIVIELNMDPNFTRYSFLPSQNPEKPDSQIKIEKNEENQNESMPDTPRSIDLENQENDNQQLGLSRSVSNAPSVHDEEMLENDIDMERCGSFNDQILDQEGSDDNDQPDDSQFKRPHNKRRAKRKKRSGLYSSSHRRTNQGNSKRHQYSFLPANIRDCTWIENLSTNSQILEEKNKILGEEKSKKKILDKIEKTEKQEQNLQNLNLLFMKQNNLQGQLSDQFTTDKQQMANFEITNNENQNMDVNNLENKKDVEPEITKQTDILMTDPIQTMHEQETNQNIPNFDMIDNIIPKNDQIDQIDQIDKNDQDKTELIDQYEDLNPEKVEIRQPMSCVPLNKLDCLEQIDEKFRNSYYHNLDRMLQDIQALVLNTIQNRCKNNLAKIYLTNFLLQCHKIIGSRRKEFKERWVHFYRVKLNNNLAGNCMVGNGVPEVWYSKFDESTKREYYELADYKVKKEGENEQIDFKHKERTQDNTNQPTTPTQFNQVEDNQLLENTNEEQVNQNPQLISGVEFNIMLEPAEDNFEMNAFDGLQIEGNTLAINQNLQNVVPVEQAVNYAIQPAINNHINQKNLFVPMKEKKRSTEDDISRIMSTNKKRKCDGTCCNKNEHVPIESITWQGMLNPESFKCPCAKNKVECQSDCGCDPEQCNNRQMSLKQALKFGIDVEEKVTWGMDTCTAVNFMMICPKDMEHSAKSDFVSQKLTYAIQQQGEKGYDVLRALKYILDADLSDEILSTKYKPEDKIIAQVMYDAIMNLPERNTRHFKIHTKGVGIFCQKKEGIECNSLVVEYFGEIYRPWHWYEKQDVIKQGQNAKKLPKDLPDFYNITFERHMDDPQGYNILTVDPILHGNFSSRLSHSCFPNCQTINKVCNGKYSIGMFTNKFISYGEELCFDYCSFTESEKEWYEAICLCGTKYCKGKYLNLANDKKMLAIMKNYHTFIDRNFIIYKSVLDDKLSDEDLDRLHRNGLKESCLDDAPVWLQKWASLICEYLEFEEFLFPKFFREDYPKDFNIDEIKIDAKNQKESQIQNIAITIDKIMHVLSQMETMEAPIRVLTSKEKYQSMWTKPGCIRENVMQVLEVISDYPQVIQVIRMINECKQFCDEQEEDINQKNEKIKNDKLQEYHKKQQEQQDDDDKILIFSPNQPVVEVVYTQEDENQYKIMFEKVREVLSDASAILRSVNTLKVAIPAFCDILKMYSSTNSYFTQTESYRKCRSGTVIIRNCDVKHPDGANMDKENQGKEKYRGCKEYDSQYIWGQLVGWFKQTVDKPNASLSADRRGTLSIPDVLSFITHGNKYEFETVNSNGVVQNNTSSNCNQPQAQKKRGKGRKDRDLITEEIMPIRTGTRSRPIKDTNQMNENTVAQDKAVENQDSMIDHASTTIIPLSGPIPQKEPTPSPQQKERFQQRVKIVYPSKKYFDRKSFLENWTEGQMFAKQWDVNCGWHFRNIQKMYGSIQLESVIKADQILEQEFATTYQTSNIEQINQIIVQDENIKDECKQIQEIKNEVKDPNPEKSNQTIDSLNQSKVSNQDGSNDKNEKKTLEETKAKVKSTYTAQQLRQFEKYQKLMDTRLDYMKSFVQELLDGTQQQN